VADRLVADPQVHDSVLVQPYVSDLLGPCLPGQWVGRRNAVADTDVADRLPRSVRHEHEGLFAEAAEGAKPSGATSPLQEAGQRPRSGGDVGQADAYRPK
jgi:hypothetical protein